MGVVIGFIPWVLFWILLGMGYSEPAALAGFLATLASVVRDVRGGKSVKILGIGTLAFFLALSIAALFMELNRNMVIVSLSANLALFLIVFISIVFGRPFTMQYAKEMAPRESWNKPSFIRTNYVISWAWCVCFVTHIMPPALRLAGASFPKWVGPLVNFGTLFLAMKFTGWYIKRQRAANISG